MIGIVPICFNFGGELVYPESEATGSALLTCSADLIGRDKDLEIICYITAVITVYIIIMI